MDEEDIERFIKGLSLKLHVCSFDFLASIPLPFSDLGKVNRVSDKAFRSLHLPPGYTGKPLRDILKSVQLQEKRVKRKLTSCCKDVHDTVKVLKTDVQETETETADSQNEPKTTAKEHHISELEYLDEEQVPEREYNQINFSDQKFKKALGCLNAFLDKKNLHSLKEVLKKSRDEVELEIGLGIHIFSKLAGNAYTSEKKSLRICPCGCQERLPENEKMSIGSVNTWYGELDILAGNPASGDTVSVAVRNEDSSGEIAKQEDEIQNVDRVSYEVNESEEEETAEENCESPGDRTIVEVCEGLNQVIAQTLVFAFTEYNRHKSKGNCIPSILIDKAGFQYVIYSPVDDILLVSNHMIYTNEDNFDMSTGFRPFVILWMILNHRLFFAKCPDFRKRFVKSGFHEKMNDLKEYNSLIDYSKRILVNSQSLHFVNDTPNTIDTATMDWFLDKNKEEF